MNEGGIFRSIRFWQGWAVAATVAALFTFIANAEFSTDGHMPDYVAVIGEADAEPLWVVNVDLGEGVLKVRAAAARPSADDQVHALWMLAGKKWDAEAGGRTDEDVALLLGILPDRRGRATFQLSEVAYGVLAHNKTLFVSREPRDRAEDAAPSAWLYEARIARL